MSTPGSDCSLPSCLNNSEIAVLTGAPRHTVIPEIKVAFKSIENSCLQHSLTDAAVGISRVWYKHQMFAQNRIATAFAHTEVNPCNRQATNTELLSRLQSTQHDGSVFESMSE